MNPDRPAYQNDGSRIAPDVRAALAKQPAEIRKGVLAVADAPAMTPHVSFANEVANAKTTKSPAGR